MEPRRDVKPAHGAQLEKGHGRLIRQIVAEQIRKVRCERVSAKDFHLLVRLKVFNTEQMNQAVFALRRYEDAPLRYMGVAGHPGLAQRGPCRSVDVRLHHSVGHRLVPGIVAVQKEARGSWDEILEGAAK